MKKSFLLILSLVILLSSVLTVIASAENTSFEDDMLDDDINVSQNAGTSSAIGSGNNGNQVGDFVGGVLSSVFSDEDVSEQVGDKVGGIFDIFDGFDFEGIIPTTPKATTGSNFFETIQPVVTGSVYPENSLSTTGSAITATNGDSVDFNTTVNPYPKPTAPLNPGDKGEGVKWLQWILIYTGCGLQGTITGDYDDSTAAAVKNLQLKYNMTVDGIASLDVIAKAEQMYNDYISGVTPQSTGAPAVFNTVSSPASQGGKNDKDTNLKVTTIIVVLIIVWIFALAAVFIIIHIKRKNISLSDDGEIIKPEKPKKVKKNKQNTAKRTSGTFKEFEPLKESKTLQSLEDDSEQQVESKPYYNDSQVSFEVIDFNSDDEYDDGEIKLSSLSEIKQRRLERAESMANDSEATVVLETEYSEDETEALTEEYSEDETVTLTEEDSGEETETLG